MYSNPAKKPLVRLLLPLLVGAMVYLLVLMAFDTIHRVLYDFFNRELLVSIGLSFLVLEGNRMLVLFSRRKLHASSRYFIGWGMFVFTIALALTFTLCSGGLILYFWQFENMSNLSNFETELKVFNGIFAFVAMFYHAYFLGFSWLNQQFQQKVAAEEEENQLLDNRIHHFHYQMNPDFLLVGLENIILKLREKQPEKADEGILLLSGIYQYFLSQQEELVPLREEIEPVKLLDAFLREFSSHRIILHLTITDAASLIVPGTLLRLVEAIGSSQLTSPEAPLEVEIGQAQDHLTLSFKPNFSLTRRQRLFQVLEQVKQQHLWLGNRFDWQENKTFIIFIPTMMPTVEGAAIFEKKANLMT